MRLGLTQRQRHPALPPHQSSEIAGLAQWSWHRFVGQATDALSLQPTAGLRTPSTTPVQSKKKKGEPSRIHTFFLAVSGRPRSIMQHRLPVESRCSLLFGLWSDLNDGVVSVVQEKTKTRLWIPLHRDLAAVLEGIPRPRRSIFLMTNRRGLPWSQDGFRTSWGKMCQRLAVPDELVFHGLRKSAVVTLLEADCTTAQIAAITGQSMQMVEHYAKQVNQRKLAASAILKWENAK